jgi:uncharacterized protein YlaN (UPF0358 family)
MKKITYIIILISFSNLKAQTKCDTNLLLKNFLYSQFGGRPIDYKNLEYKDYIKCSGIDTVNKLLLYIVGLEWQYKYYKHKVEKDKWQRADFMNEAKRLSKKDTSKIIDLADSLLDISIKKDITRYLGYQVSPFNIRLCGYLNLKESIPILQKALTLPKRYDTEVVKLTLSKLGDTITERNYFNDMLAKKDFNFNDFFGKYSKDNLTYINTQNAYYMYSKKLLVKDVLLDGEPGDYFKRQLRNEILTFLVQNIKNEELTNIAYSYYKKYNLIFYKMFPLKKNIDFNSTEKMISDKDIKVIMSWFEKNKGHYIITQ